jgi:hypothetical protein
VNAPAQRLAVKEIDEFKRCPTCCGPNDVLPAASFYRNPSRRGGLSSQCRQCHHRVEQDYYARNTGRERAKRKVRNALVRRANQARMMEYLRDRACNGCGIDDPVVLEFHHIGDRGRKHAPVSVLVTHGYSWLKVQAEIAKCEILCANCHRKRTASERGHYRSVRPSRVDRVQTQSGRAIGAGPTVV